MSVHLRIRGQSNQWDVGESSGEGLSRDSGTLCTLLLAHMSWSLLLYLLSLPSIPSLPSLPFLPSSPWPQ
jgi:hypothetical protein